MTVIASSFLIWAASVVIKNPYRYTYLPSFNIYLGHTKMILVFIPIFLYYLWRFHPFWAFIYLPLLYCFHEFVFNIFFFAYYWQGIPWAKYYLNIPFTFVIIGTIAILALKWYKPNRLASTLFLFFMGMMGVWIFGFHFEVTSNITLSVAQNIIDNGKFIPNLFESLYNILFGMFFVLFVRITKAQKAVTM
jgi:hypothetical protein